MIYWKEKERQDTPGGGVDLSGEWLLQLFEDLPKLKLKAFLCWEERCFVVRFSSEPSFLMKGEKLSYDEVWSRYRAFSKTLRRRYNVFSTFRDGEPEHLIFLVGPVSERKAILIQMLLKSAAAWERERRALERALWENEYLAYHDPLTDLPNRRYLEIFGERYLTLARREKKEVFVVFLDLLGFKRINDLYGHNTGDEVLKVVSDRFRKVVRESDLVARIGGDEFVMLLYDMKKDGLKRFLERLYEQLECPMKTERIVLRISANLGVSRFPQEGEELKSLVELADQRMYEAKRLGLPFVLGDNSLPLNHPSRLVGVEGKF